MRANLGLRMRITVALAVTAAATALFAVLGAMWIISGIIDRADQRELRSHYDALQSRIAEESQRAAAMSAVVAAIPATQDAMAKQDRNALIGLFGPVFAATLFDKHPALPYLICAALSFLTSVIAWQFLHRPNQTVIAAKTQSTG